MKTIKVRSALTYSSSHATIRGLQSAVDFWPTRAIILGNQSTDNEKLRKDWQRVGEDIRVSMDLAINGAQ